MRKHGFAKTPAVLVVEDEPLLLMLAMDMVEEAGFEALGAAGSNEALRILEGHHDIRLVFTDVDMPDGVNGLRLAAMVRERWPPIEIIVTSGLRAPPEEMIPERGLFLPKPYDEAQVTSAIHRMLSRSECEQTDGLG